MQTKLLLCVVAFCLTGCVTISKRSQIDPIIEMQKGNYALAEQAIATNYPADSNNKLLRHLELGTINHLNGQFDKSNQHFNQAESISESFYTTSISDEAAELFTGSSYKGFVFENTFVNYFKALNYLKQGQLNGKLSQAELDTALIEVRRLSTKLSELTQNSGGYVLKNAKKEDDGSLNNKFSNFFNEVLSSTVGENIEYKDDAFAHYISALLYEMNNELDSARIEYQKAAQAYENGFSKQYSLTDQATKQVWFDTLQLMQKAGGYENEWPKLAKKKLNKTQQKRLRTNDHHSELVIIQHSGIAPKRNTLNMILTADLSTHSFNITPFPKGHHQDRQDQLNWFNMLYADKSPFDYVQNYLTGNIIHALKGNLRKTLPLGPLWDTAIESGLIKAIGHGIRVAVPYYPQLKSPFGKTELIIDGQVASTFITLESIEKIAVQEQLRNANSQIQSAIVSALIKALAAQKALKATGLNKGFLGELAKATTKVMNAATSGADTRNWLTLPANINVARTQLAPGQHEIIIKTHLTDGQIIEQKETVNIIDKQIAFMQIHTFSKMSSLNKMNTNIEPKKTNTQGVINVTRERILQNND
ncbi:hypothetical protein [Algibacillus agarilyticus]|uniref:hypothetical protein n=1 Tax=Algibacillus agarilyticus TaxID=2234133 RepID=UPI000DD0E68B|nr:hypothetical protein [Algibacillus agarilyticus]